jgi:arginine decarboxylase
MSASDQGMASSDFSSLHLWNMSSRVESHPGFHMPGHAGARFFPKGYADTLVSIDTTELTSSDDLHEPAGPALLAMRESSRLYGSAETIYVTTGSTTGIHVILASIASSDTFLLIPRTVHMSVLHALALLDIKYAFIPFFEPEAESLDFFTQPEGCLYPQLSLPLLENALERYPCATDILLVSPDYYGQCADLKVLSETAHRHGCRLLVDEAHGSHLAFAKDKLPPDAMKCGADMCVQSLHKSLPALTMASQIHISVEAVREGRISASRVWEMLRVFETSSPSFLIAASSEYALAWMSKYGHQAIIDRIYEIQEFIAKIEPLLGSQSRIYQDPLLFDPMHLVLTTNPERIFAPDLMTALEKQGIHVEFADLFRLVLIISPWQTKKDFDLLYDAVGVAEKERKHMLSYDINRTDRLWRTALTRIPKAALPLRTAIFGGISRESVEISQSLGRVCAVTIAPYPPGIAILWPGERIAEEYIELILKLINLGYTIRGITNGSTDVLIV